MKNLSFRIIPVLLFCFAACNNTPEKPLVQKSEVDTLRFFTGTQMDSLLKSDLESAAKTNPSALLASHVLGVSAENAPYLLGIRTGPGSVETHEFWDDVAIIRSGHAILRTGYRVSGERKEDPEHSGNWVGGVLQDGKERHVAPGDFIIIPANLSHQYIPNPGDSLTYWTIKVKRPKK